MSTTIRIPIRGEWWMSSNQRLFWRDRAARTAHIRAAAKLHAISSGIGAKMRVHIEARVCYPTARKADPANAYPTIKACVDGLVDAGVIPDDDAEHVIGPDMRLGKSTKTKGQYVIDPVITPQEIP